MLPLRRIKSWLWKLRHRKEAPTSSQQNPEDDKNEASQPPYEPVPEDYPAFPPPPPQEILQDPAKYWATVIARKLYEYIVLDKVFGYRNMLEWFWRQPNWPVCEIPDPEDNNPARYAFLACVTYLMAKSYNARVAIGLTRGAPAIMTMDEAEEAKNRPENERPYEKIPLWAEKVPPLAETLSIPTHDGVTLDSKDDERADQDFLAKNILLWTPHIHFT